jgi:hypothetical protein
MPFRPLRRRLFPAVLLVSGCTLFWAEAPAPPPEAEVLEPVSADVRVSLLWSDGVDLDLYVTDPDRETVYFANNPSGSGGILQQDVQCGDLQQQGEAKPPLVETAYWRKARPGRYRIGVDFIDACGSGLDGTEFRIVVETGDEQVEQLAKAALERFEPVVLEFDFAEREETK